LTAMGLFLRTSLQLGHVFWMHTLSLQTGVLAPHAFPQPPQLAASLVVSDSQPLLGDLSQSAYFGWQPPAPQTPLAHTAPRWFAGSGQTFPQPLQLRASVASTASQPSKPILLQSPYPDAHCSTEHLLAMQVAVAWGRLAHALPHVPQFFESLAPSTSQPSLC